MLESGQRSLGRDEFHIGGRRRVLLRPRVIVGLALVAAGVVWALARGVHFYGVTPVDLAYDLDQPPWLLVLVSAWLVYRSWRR